MDITLCFETFNLELVELDLRSSINSMWKSNSSVKWQSMRKLEQHHAIGKHYHAIGKHVSLSVDALSVGCLTEEVSVSDEKHTLNLNITRAEKR